MKNLFKIQKYSLSDGIFDFNIDHSVTKVIKKFYEDTPFPNYKENDNIEEYQLTKRAQYAYCYLPVSWHEPTENLK